MRLIFIAIFQILIANSVYGNHPNNSTITKTLDSLYHWAKEHRTAQVYIKAWNLAEKGRKKAASEGLYLKEIEFMNLQAVLHDETGNTLESIRVHFEVREMLKKHNASCKLRIANYINTSISYKNITDFEKAIEFAEKARKLSNSCPASKDLKYNATITAISAYLQNNNLTKARELLKILEQARAKEPGDWQISYKYWLARYYQKSHEYEKAIHSLKDVIAYDSMRGGLKNYFEDKFLLGEIQSELGLKEASLQTFLDCYLETERSGNIRLKHSSAERLMDYYFSKKDSLNALRYLLIYTATGDSIRAMNDKSILRKLEFANDIALIKLKEHQKEEKWRLTNERNTWEKRFILLIGSFLLVLMSYLVYWLRKTWKARLNVKKKELVRYSAEIHSRNEAINKAITSLETQLTRNADDDKGSFRSLLFTLRSELNNDDFWHDFEIRFTEVHSDFYQTLLKKHPDLSKNELRICAFVKLNFTSKEIEGITKKSVNSINVTKHRIKQKLALHQNQSLYNYIQSI